MKAIRESPLLDLFGLFFRVALFRNFHERTIDDGSSIHLKTFCVKDFVESVEHGSFQSEVFELFGKEPDRFRIVNDVGKVEIEKISEGESVSKLSFGLFVGEVVQVFQDEDFEHQYDIEGFSSGIEIGRAHV